MTSADDDAVAAASPSPANVPPAPALDVPPTSPVDPQLLARAQSKREAARPAVVPSVSPEERERELLRMSVYALVHGKDGVDYFTRSRCDVCGAVPFYFRNRLVELHDPEKHAVPVERDENGEVRAQPLRPRSGSAGAMPDVDMDTLARVRRSTGEHDDDDED